MIPCQNAGGAGGGCNQSQRRPTGDKADRGDDDHDADGNGPACSQAGPDESVLK